MTAPLSPSVQHQLSQVEHRKGNHGMSPRKFSGPPEARSYRRHFAEKWSAYLKASFDSPAHVAHVFKVDPSTAEKWWMGSHQPQGWVVGYALGVMGGDLV